MHFVGKRVVFVVRKLSGDTFSGKHIWHLHACEFHASLVTHAGGDLLYPMTCPASLHSIRVIAMQIQVTAIHG